MFWNIPLWFFFQFGTATVTETAFFQMFRCSAALADLFLLPAAEGAGVLGGHDPRRDGDDAVAHHHDDRSHDLSQRRHRGDLAVAHGGERDDDPIDAVGNAMEAVIALFDHVHQCAQQAADDDHEVDENGDLSPPGLDGQFQLGFLTGEARQVQHPEQPQQPQRPDHDQHLAAGDEERKVHRQDRDEVDDAVKTEDVPSGLRGGNDPQDVLEGEEDGDRPFGNVQEGVVFGVQGLHALEHHQKNAQKDEAEQRDVEQFPVERVHAVNDDVDFLPKDVPL